MRRFISITILSAIFYLGLGQSSAEDSTIITNYLNSQLEYLQERLSCQMLDSISSVEFYRTKMNFLLNDGASIPTSYELIKTETGFKPVYSSQELICCPEFIASIQKDYCLKDENAAFRFQEILDVVDRWNNTNSDRAFFKRDNSWYFIRDVFFDDYEFFMIETNKKGKIQSISYHKDKLIEVIPEDKIKSNRHSAEWGYKTPVVSNADSAYLRSYFDEKTNFHWEFTKQESRLAEKITSADFYNAKIVFTEQGFSSATCFNVLKWKNTIIHANSARELLEDPVFKESLNKNFILKSEDDALSIEEALDAIAPVGTFDVDDKEHMLVDGKWFFVRSESFGDKAAFIIETDSNGIITDFTYNNQAIKKQD